MKFLRDTQNATLVAEQYSVWSWWGARLSAVPAVLVACSVLASGQPDAVEGTVPDGLSGSDWSSIREAYETGRHALRRQGDGTHAARNPGQRWRTEFDGRGFVVNPDHGKWTWGMNLQGCGGQDFRSAVSKVITEGNTITYRWSENFEEWFRNDRRGLEQGWTIQERAVPMPGLLTLEFTLRGSLTPRISPDRRSVTFENRDGTIALTYGGLKAWDAENKLLDVRFVAGVNHASLAISVDDAEAVYPITIDPIAQQQAYLKQADPKLGEAGDEFGASVAVSGDTVVIGAPAEDSDSTIFNRDSNNNDAQDSGAAYVFVRRGTLWIQEAYLKASNTESGDGFGSSVSISGDAIVVGAPGEDSAATGVDGDRNDNSASGSGAAYVYQRETTVFGTGWGHRAYLKASNTGANDSFGRTVDIDGDTVLVGAPTEDSADTGVGGTGSSNSSGDSGAVYIFKRNNTVWSPEAYVKASNTNASDRFGQSVSISGDTAVVGALLEDSTAPSSGAAYVFVRNGTAWSEEALLKASNAEVLDYFGVAVAVDGDTAVVGARREDSAARDVGGDGSNNAAVESGAAYIFTRSGTTWSEEAYLKASNADGGDYFGSAVAVSGDTVVIGAEREDSNAAGVGGDEGNNSMTFAGAAYVFTRSGTAWSQEAYLKASDPGGSDLFGSAVAVSGDSVIIGAKFEDGPLNSAGNSGAAYAYARSGSIWSDEDYLKAPLRNSGDIFGTSIAISGDTVVVGAPEEDSAATGVNGNATDDSAEDSGAAYVFVRSGNQWSQQAYLKASNTGAGDNFGFSVAISSETIVVGAPEEDSFATGVNGDEGDIPEGTSSGAAYAFVRNGTTWTQQAYLKASNTNAGDEFGTAVAVSGDTVVVGAPKEDSNATEVNGDQSDNSMAFSGADYVFTRSGTTWSQEAYLKASNAEARDYFGSAVAVSGNTVVIGAGNEDSAATGVNSDENDNSAEQSGAAYVFVRGSMGTWIQEAYLKASNTGGVDFFGGSVGISGDTVVVGAYGEDSGATGVNGDQSDNSMIFSGAGYIFTRSGTTWSQEAYLKASNTEARDEFGTSVAVSGNTVVIGAPGAETSALGTGAAYLYVRAGTTWGLASYPYLEASNFDREHFFGRSVAISGDTVVVGDPNEDSAATGVNGDGSNDYSQRSGASYVFVIPPGPEIRLVGPGGSELLSGTGTVDYGPDPEGVEVPLGYTVWNLGTDPLNGIAASVGGPDAGDFHLATLPGETLIPGQSSSFVVLFTAPASSTTSDKTATLSIASNDVDENPFTVTLTGKVLSFSSDGDGDGMNDASELQLADLGFDWEVNQASLVDTLFDNMGGLQPNLNEEGFYTTAQVHALYAPAPLISRNAGTGKFTLTMDWKKSADLENFFDFRADDPGSSVTVDTATGDIEFEFDSLDDAAFFRVEVE